MRSRRDVRKLLLRALPLSFPALLMPVILVCLYSRATMPTEAAAAAAMYLLLVSAFLYRAMNWCDAYNSLLSSARVTASIGMLVAGAMVFNYVITVENIPKTLAATLKAVELSPVPPMGKHPVASPGMRA